MNVIGDAPGHRDELCPWRNHRKPASRRERLDDPFQTRACFAEERPCQVIKTQKATHTGYLHYLAVSVDRAVAIAASEPSRDRSGMVKQRRNVRGEQWHDEKTVFSKVRAPA